MLDHVVVATDSVEIAEAVRQFGGRCEMTRKHSSGTDRIAEVVDRCYPGVDLVVNSQGDEPEIEPGHLDVLISSLAGCPEADMATLACPISTIECLSDPSCVKVVCGLDGAALYFSRAPIPHCRDGDVQTLLDAHHWLLHIGAYAYRREVLLSFALQPASVLEQLEQLRALESGRKILVNIVGDHSPGVDTWDDYECFVRRSADASKLL